MKTWNVCVFRYHTPLLKYRWMSSTSTLNTVEETYSSGWGISVRNLPPRRWWWCANDIPLCSTRLEIPQMLGNSTLPGLETSVNLIKCQDSVRLEKSSRRGRVSTAIKLHVCGEFDQISQCLVASCVDISSFSMQLNMKRSKNNSGRSSSLPWNVGEFYVLYFMLPIEWSLGVYAAKVPTVHNMLCF